VTNVRITDEKSEDIFSNRKNKKECTMHSEA